MRTGILSAMALGTFVLLSACEFDRVETGPTVTDPISVDAGGADRANVQLNMSAGEMKVSGGGSKLLEGTVAYNVPRWKPEVTSTHNGVHATVTIRQPDHGGSFGHVHNLWDLQLADKILLDLTVNCGAGQARLNLGDVRLRDLQVHMGAGQVDLDLTGKPQRDYEVTIHGGVGQASVHLPQDVGIWATAKGGIGSIVVTGLEKQGDHWQNDLYDKSKVNVRIDVKGGIGEIRLIG